MILNKLIVFLVFSLFVSNIALSQNADEEKFKLAESYEKNGDFKSAARMYSDLFNEQPGNDAYFQGLVRSYKAMNQFSDLWPIIEKRLSVKKNPDSYAIYGEILWRTGKTSEANKAWENAISLAPRSPDTYLDVANSQISLRLFDKSVSTLEKGRSELNSSTVFSDQLSQLYIATGNFAKGTNEVLNLFEQTNNLGIAQGRLSALLSNPDAASYVNSIIKSRADGDNINYKKLYAWFLRSTKKYEEAFEVYKKIDAMQASNGMEVLNFANSSSSDGQTDIALKAYEYIIDMGR
jgi:tetratricopeptide (TPR) repeat protein